MPESGTFLAGIKNKVAFKVTDEKEKDWKPKEL